MKRNPYKILNIDPDATPEEVKAAYREKAKAHHPDKGGDNGAFSEINNAYALLSSPEKRKRYDETGDTGDSASAESKARTQILLFISAIFDSGPEKFSQHDIFKELRLKIASARSELNRKLKRVESAIAAAEKAKSKASKAPMVAMVMETKIAEAKTFQAQARQELEVLVEMESQVEQQEFMPDKVEEPRWTAYSSLFTSTVA